MTFRNKLFVMIAWVAVSACLGPEQNDDDPSDAGSLPPTEVTSAAVPLTGLVGWWPFDERTGTTANDKSGFAHNATLSGGAAFSIPDKPVIDDNGSSLSNTGTNTSVATAPASSSFDLLSSFSVMFWAKIPTGAVARFIGIRASGCGTLSWEILQNRRNQLHFAGPGGQIRSFGTSLTANTWTHVGVTYSGGTMRLYLNGAQVATGAYTPGTLSGRPLAMGHVGNCNGRAALMDDVLIYSRALTATEVASLSAIPAAPTSLTIASKNSVAMNLTWTTVAGVELHIIEKGTAAGNETFYTHSQPAPSFPVDHLSPNTQYSFRVRAVKNGLYSPPSTEVIGTTLAGPTTPTGVAASLVVSDRIQVTWSAVSTAVKYYVFRSAAGGAFTFVGSVVAPTTTFLSANLAPATTYAYQVQAEDVGQVVSGMSASASATTP